MNLLKNLYKEPIYNEPIKEPIYNEPIKEPIYNEPIYNEPI